MGSAHWNLKGVNEWLLDIDRVSHYMDSATKEGVNRGAFLLTQDISLALSEKSHPMGTKTPSAPGEPPALITGSLKRSVYSKGAVGKAGRYAAKVGPRTVYARIQELGGHAGKNHRSYLPPRPYVKPALDSLKPVLGERIKDLWKRVWGGGGRSTLQGDRF